MFYEIKTITAKVFNQDYFKIEDNNDLIKDKIFCFGYFYIFVTRPLVLRQRNAYS